MVTRRGLLQGFSSIVAALGTFSFFPRTEKRQQFSAEPMIARTPTGVEYIRPLFVETEWKYQTVAGMTTIKGVRWRWMNSDGTKSEWQQA